MSDDTLLLISADPRTIEYIKSVSAGFNLSVKVRKSISSGVRASVDSQVVLIDNPLPDGDCIECLRNLHDLNDNLVAIAIIDNDMRDKRIEALMNNAFFYITKPLLKRELEAVLGKALAIKRLIEENERIGYYTVEDFLRKKLGGSLSQLKRVGDINLYDTVISEVEKALLRLAFEATGGNQLKTSRLLGINRNTVRAKMKKYRLNRS
jgi:DNA-binding NtrC family response regulator